ncbi:hypothetical protein GH818_28645, partial [Bacillus thuringiensis]|nr:hypothetical protein [Bacillus thuringiensis]
TNNGKIDRKALLKIKRTIMEVKKKMEPRTKNQKIIATLWKDVLKIDNVNVEDSFFELGGNSILIIKVISAIEKEFAIKLS